MEVIDYLVILTVVGMISGVLLFVFNRISPAKRAKNSIFESIKQLNEVKDEQIETIMGRYKTELKSTKASLKARMKEDAEITESTEKVTWKDVKPLLISKGINPLILELPNIEEYANKFLKGKSIEEVSQLAETLPKLLSGKGGIAGLFGDQGSKEPDAAEFGQFKEEFR